MAISFLLIFSFQILPVKVIGKFLSSGQNVEEVQNDADTDSGGDSGTGSPDMKVLKVGEDQIINSNAFDLQASRAAFNNKICAFIHQAESIPSVHVSPMPSPPPDII